MATKNRNKPPRAEAVEIDQEAYLRLEAARGEDESISEVIKRCVRPRQTAEEILATMRKAAASLATLQSIEESAIRRRSSAYKSKG